MTISAIIYDLVGPLLVRNPDVLIDSQVQEINKRCGTVTNEKKFWKDIAAEYSYSDQELEEVKIRIAFAYKKNEPMWDFHQKVKNHYKTAVLNNGTLRIFEYWKKQFQLESEFDYLLNSSELGMKKPDPKIFTYCLNMLSVPADQCIFIDDDKTNTDAAASLGIHSILYAAQRHATFLETFNNVL